MITGMAMITTIQGHFFLSQQPEGYGQANIDAIVNVG